MKLSLPAALALALTLGGCVTAPPPSASMTAPSGSATTLGRALNAARAANGLPALAPDPALAAAAREQARFMARTRRVTHTGAGGSTVGTRVRRAGCSWDWVGENLAFGLGSPQATMSVWMQSADHRANTLNRTATAYGSAQVGPYRALVLASGC